MSEPFDFSGALIDWQRRHGRHDLPWQTRDPYRVWLSEIMLQQTQVVTVIPYYERFLARFPDLASLAAADTAEVLGLWSGLGYYARARNLHRCAQQIGGGEPGERGGTGSSGEFPRTVDELALLPGIGRSTAAAIAVFAFGARAAILDGNVKRVLCRCFAIEGFPGAAEVETKLWTLAESLLPIADIETYTQGLMDLGATTCTRRQPGCAVCPLSRHCAGRAAGRVHELPTARPKRAVPHRESRVLILVDGDDVLLEARAAAGIWGGLLAPPEMLAGETPPHAAARFGLLVGDCRELAPVRHAFTHFRLRLHPLLAAVTATPRVAEAGALTRLHRSDLEQAPLPAPIRRLLEKLWAAPPISPSRAGPDS